jgi:hypothetical protein
LHMVQARFSSLSVAIVRPKKNPRNYASRGLIP